MNPHCRDKDIVFIENTHKYLVKNIDPDEITSVTSLIHSYFPPFNAEKVIEKMRASENFNDSKYAEMTDKEIMKKWRDDAETASKEGTNLHKKIEEFYLGSDSSSSEHNQDFKYFLNFNDTIKDQYKIYRTEWSIYVEEFKIAGQLDALFVHKDTGEFLLCDWKRSKEIKMNNKFEKGLGCLAHLDNCNYNHYSIQLNIYKYILENYYGLKISKMMLVILHPNQEDYKTINVADMSAEVQDILNDRH